MATLALTVVGGIFGGPVGAMIGATVGGVIDREVLFKPKGREGPRLTELAVQTSSYGTPIPQLFGTMRVAGTVIWATDLIETRATQGGGKGRPSTTTYSYSASFAVLLSARAILGVRRIWADGKLLRGSAGDFKSTIGAFRLHGGGEDQAVDPLIASAEGIGLTPAHRGQAYAVFEGLALADFGNRIPSLTFEVEADADPVSAGAVVEAVSGGLVNGAGLSLPLSGYSAYGGLRALADGLAQTGGAWFAPADDRLVLRAGDGAVVEIADAGSARRVRSIAPADSVPARLSIQHHDAARDYQAGLQRAERPGAGAREARIELPGVLEAGAAKSLAGAALARLDVERERRTVALDWRAIGVAPGDRVSIAGEAGRWRVSGWSLEAMVLTLDLVRLARAPMAVPAAPGRVIGAPDLLAGETIVHAVELPSLDDTLLSAPRLSVFAAGTGAGWRSAALQLSLDGGAQWNPVGASAAAAVLGAVMTAPGVASAALVDRRNSLIVDLAHEGMLLNDADDAALDAGINLALVGDELLQFAQAEQIGPLRWRLSGLLRGRRGTEWAIGAAGLGDRFILVEPDAMVTIDLPVTALGGTASVMAAGPGDDAPPVATAAISGASIVPPSPAALTAIVGDMVAITWHRRSRIGWRWIDGVDAPLGEEVERYRVTIHSGDGVSAIHETNVPQLGLPAIAGPAPFVEVRQIGVHGLSRPAVLPLN